MEFESSGVRNLFFSYLFFAINRIVDEKSTAFLLHFGFYWKKGFLIKGGSYVDFLVQE
ncbi:hypothetical protein B4065_1017 [Caldibacillus thermoamylovorans]|nr:hypothetical protein B4065_1017 [Caldibacillus thermoamylovorans]